MNHQTPRSWWLDVLGNAVHVQISSPEDSDLRGKSGSMYLSQQWIALSTNLGPEQLQSTLLHEIIEWVVGANGMTLEESDIRTLEVGLFEILTRNGVSLKSLMGEE